MQIIKYFKVWKQLSSCAISSYLSNRIDSLGYFIGKLIRFAFFIILIFSIFKYTNNLGGYSKYEIIMFFLTFNLMDVLAQVFFRGIYLFKDDVRLGNFDYIISKPINPLFYSLTRLTDILDMLFLIPIIGLIIYAVLKLHIILTLLNFLIYLFFIALGILIILGIHIFSACVTIWTMESENFIWFYREAMTIGRFPPKIYSNFVQIIFTYLMPIIVIVAFPTKALLGQANYSMMFIATVITIIFFNGSLFLWKISLKRYSSASS